MNKHVEKKRISLRNSLHTRFSKTMKLVLFLSLLNSQIIAADISAQSVNVKLSLRSPTVAEVVQKLHQQTNYEFAYDADILHHRLKSVSVDVKNEHIETVLAKIFGDSGINYKVMNNRIFLKKSTKEEFFVEFEKSVLQQQPVGKNISGTIVDANGEPIIGANIVEIGTVSNGTVTDYDGVFSLHVAENATIRISYIGYLDQEISTVGKTSFEIVLKEDTKTLDEVVVVGYTTQRKESLTGALQTIKSDKLKDITSPSVENMLNGKAPGVFVAPGSGQPGRMGTIVIRGKSTVNGSTDPLWVIDGVIVGNNSGSLNPVDIETMTILKDAASTAIYGSQGANGVIVVTTKNPQVDKLSVSLSAKAGVTNLVKGNLQVMNGAELYDYYKSFANVEQISFPRWNDDLRNSNFSWWDLASQTGIVQDYNLTISGGSEKLRSLMSLGVYDESGAVKGYKFTRYNFLFKADFRPTDWLKVKPYLSGSRRDIDDRQYSVSAMYANLPWDSPYDKDGNIVGHKSPLWVNSNSTNYLYDLQWNFGKSTRYEFMGNFDFDINLMEGLVFSSVNSIQYHNLASKLYAHPRSSSAEGVKGRINEYRYEIIHRYTNQKLLYNRFFGKHSVNALLAYEFKDYTSKSVSATGIGFVPGFEVLDVTAKPEKTKGGIAQHAKQSFFANINYTYDNKYLAQLSARRDGASNFGTNAKYGNFFSISGGWNIHREDFFNSEIVNELKLRVSYGSVGNPPYNTLYPQYDLYAVSAGASYNELSGALISQIGNRDLTWEKSYTTGIGIDATFYDRLRFTLDLYEKNTSDLLYDVPVSGLTGVTRVWRNVGAVRNRGFEVSASVDVVKNKDLLWTIDANIGLNRNKVTELYGVRDATTGEVAPIIKGDGVGIAGSANKILREGADADTWWLKEWAGVNPDDGSPLWYTGQMVKDADGNEVREKSSNYAKAAFVEAGAYTPKYSGGFSTSLLWKKFDANIVFGYSVGGKIYNYSRAEYDSDGAYSDRNQMRLIPSWSRWEKKGDIATHPIASYNNKTNSNKVSTRYLEDGTYLKLRNIQLGYNLSLPKYHLSNVRLYISGENLFTLTKYSGVDPEIPTYVDSSGTRKITGVTTTVYPTTRKFLFGINVTF